MPLDDIGRTDRAVANGIGDAGGGGRDGDHAQPSRPTIGGTRNRPSSACGGGGQHLVTVEHGRLDVVAHHVDQRVGLGHRGDVGEVEGIDVGEVFEHVGQLRRRELDLLSGQIETGETGHLGDDIGGDAFGHVVRG